jgi:hypothetical protein
MGYCINKFLPAKSGAGSPFKAILYTHLYSPLHSAHDQLTPFPSLLRKEGRACDKVSNMIDLDATF